MQRLALLMAALLALAACGSGGGGDAAGDAAAAGPPQRGGEVTDLLGSSYAGSWPAGLDPATNTTGGANLTQMNAIYGGLFQIRANDDGSDAEVRPNQAESSQMLGGGTTVQIKIRSGITFTDGTPMDADAVAFNIKRALASPCTCSPTWPITDDPVTVVDPLTVAIHFTRPYAAAINSFPVSNVNWMASPTALQKLGEDQFKISPVGAGPFMVESNQLSSKLVLVRNPTYFRPGLPYLDKLTIQSIGGDQPAYQALLAGQAQAYEGLGTTPLIEQAQGNSKLTVTSQPSTSPYVIQLNTRAAPFDNELAREAIYYATDFAAISKGLFKDQYTSSQMFTGPGGLFHHQDVPGYRTYDPEKAKQIVAQLGGLNIKLGTIGGYVAQQVTTALQTQWQAAGITTTIESYELSSLIQEFNSGKWQSMLQTAGAWDPAAGSGVSFRFASNTPFSGVSDPQLDDLLAQAAASVDPAQRDALYLQAGERISDQAYAPFGLAFSPTNVAVKGVYGPGLTTKIPPILVNSAVIWDEVWTSDK